MDIYAENKTNLLSHDKHTQGQILISLILSNSTHMYWLSTTFRSPVCRKRLQQNFRNMTLKPSTSKAKLYHHLKSSQKQS